MEEKKTGATAPVIHDALAGAEFKRDNTGITHGGDAPQPVKRRGRPPKQSNPEAAAAPAADTAVQTDAPKKRGRKPGRPASGGKVRTSVDELYGEEKPTESGYNDDESVEQEPQAPNSRRQVFSVSPESLRKIRRFPRSQLAPFKPDPDALPVRIIPLGGLEEIGKNMTIFEYGDDAIMVDCGQSFPQDDELFGVDVVIPDMTYIEQVKEKLRGIVITHGHEDHIGCLPYLLNDYALPVFGTKLVIGLVSCKMKEHNLVERQKLFGVISAGDVVSFGSISVEFFTVNHSIPDAVGLIIRTPAGVIVHTGDFKIDFTPLVGEMMDLGRLSQVGREGVLLLMSDSTNSERPGLTASERTVGVSFDSLFEKASKSRIIVATFASNIHRVQQIINAAQAFGRKVAVSGRSMINTVGIAIELGYLTVPDGLLIEIEDIVNYPPEQLVLITTGSQGEPMSALSRMSLSDHRKVEVGNGDFVIISATPIPGNERMVARVVSRLMKLGAEVIYERMYDVHVSGHACQEEQKLVLVLTKPKFFMPVHGEYKHMRRHCQTAESIGVPRRNMILAENGNILELTADSFSITGSIPAGRVFVDGLGVGDVGSVVLRDRRRLSQDGILTVNAVLDIMEPRLLAGPDIMTRGFVFVKESEKLLDSLRETAMYVIQELLKRNVTDINIYRSEIHEAVSKKIYQTIKRSPIIVPIIMDYEG